MKRDDVLDHRVKTETNPLSYLPNSIAYLIGPSVSIAYLPKMFSLSLERL